MDICLQVFIEQKVSHLLMSAEKYARRFVPGDIRRVYDPLQVGTYELDRYVLLRPSPFDYLSFVFVQSVPVEKTIPEVHEIITQDQRNSHAKFKRRERTGEMVLDLDVPKRNWMIAIDRLNAIERAAALDDQCLTLSYTRFAEVAIDKEADGRSIKDIL